VYYIGNSVTDTIRYGPLTELAATRGVKITWGRHMIPGAPLEWLYTHPNDGFREEPFGGWQKALNEFAWDVVSLQPFDCHLYGKNDKGEEVGDVELIVKLARMAATKNPDVQVYIYARWPRVTVGGKSVPFDKNDYDPAKPGSGNDLSKVDDYLTRWEAKYTGGWDATNETRDYFENLLREVRKATPELKKPVLLVPVGHVLAELHAQMKAGKVPGWTSIYQFYKDGIHLNEPGSYTVACTYFATLLKQSPAGQPTQPYGEIGAQLAKVIQQTAWRVVRSVPEALPGVDRQSAQPSQAAEVSAVCRDERREVEGWTVRVRAELIEANPTQTARALQLLQEQLKEIVRVAPTAAVEELRKVPLYFSPEYPGERPRAEYHPDAGWLREHGRDPAMAKAVEFSNVQQFEAEMNRMPNFALHELAHAFHHRVLPKGFANPEIKAAYTRARTSGKYDRVERRFGHGKANTFERAYAMNDAMEYFAETSEAFFGRNDFFPFTREELIAHDPEMFVLLVKLWGAEANAGSSRRATAAARKQAPVDFNHPPRDYVTHRLHGWEVLVEKQLAEEAPELATTTLARLEKKLGEIAALLPETALPDLRRLKVFLMHGPQAKGGGRSNGLEYFQANSPRHWDWLDARMASSVVIFNAANYAKLTEHWALKSLMHEFGHAQHLEHWPEDRADIYDTWQTAMKAGLYKVVREEDKDTHNPNYAAQNHLEYFAELTVMYFVGANYFPKDRAGLKAYDPAGYGLVEKLWRLDCANSPHR
jgi:Mlc titration factor MtfA (ptsG expression regulator)